MCMKMEEALVEHELHSAPKLFLKDDLDKEQRERVKVRSRIPKLLSEFVHLIKWLFAPQTDE